MELETDCLTSRILFQKVCSYKYQFSTKVWASCSLQGWSLKFIWWLGKMQRKSTWCVRSQSKCWNNMHNFYYSSKGYQYRKTSDELYLCTGWPVVLEFLGFLELSLNSLKWFLKSPWNNESSSICSWNVLEFCFASFIKTSTHLFHDSSFWNWCLYIGSRYYFMMLRFS